MAPPAKACAACRLRKVKCPGLENGHFACATCMRLNIKCQFVAVKRGRPLSAKTREVLAVNEYSDLSAIVQQSESAVEVAHTASLDINHGGQVEQEQAPLAVIISSLEQPFARNGAYSTAQAQGTKVFFEKPDNDYALSPVHLGIVSEEQARFLFILFIERMNGYTGLLDPALHSFDYVASRSGLLLSVCLQVAAARSLGTDLLAKQLLTHIRDALWPNILIRNLRSVAICQGCMIWGSFADTRDISDDETTWFLYGHALRMSVELGLSRDLQANAGHSAQDRAVLRDAQRCWLTCFIADRSWAAQTSRPPLIMENALTLSAQGWLVDSAASTDDASITALVDYRRILERMPGLPDHDVYRAHTAFESITRDLSFWLRVWSGDEHAGCKRLSQMIYIYYQYAMCLVHSRKLSLRLRNAAPDLKDAAIALVGHAANSVPGEEFIYAHNSFYTMLLYGFHCCYKFRNANTDRTRAPGPDQEALNQIIEFLEGQFDTPEKAGSGALSCLKRLKRLQEAYRRSPAFGDTELGLPQQSHASEQLQSLLESGPYAEIAASEIPVPLADDWEQVLLASDPLALFQQDTFDFWASLGLTPNAQMSL